MYEQLPLFSYVNEKEYISFDRALKKVQESPELKSRWREYTYVLLKTGEKISWQEYLQNSLKYRSSIKEFLFLI